MKLLSKTCNREAKIRGDGKDEFYNIVFTITFLCFGYVML